MGKTHKEEVAGPPERIGFSEIDGAADLTHYLDRDSVCADQKFVVITGHTPGAYFWNAAFAHFLLLPVTGLAADDTTYHANLLKAFVDGRGRFGEARRRMREHVECFLDQRGYRWCVEGGGHLYQRGGMLIAAEDSGDFGPFLRMRVQHLLTAFAVRTDRRSLVLGGADGGNRAHPILNFRL